ncbi:MAG: Ig-like domain-containing protein [Bdellovibrionia bacterium]
MKKKKLSFGQNQSPPSGIRALGQSILTQWAWFHSRVKQSLQTHLIDQILSFQVLSLLSLILSSCNYLGNEALVSGTLGIQTQIVSGNQQITYANTFFNAPLTVRVVDPTTGAAIPGTQVDFTELTNTQATLITAHATTDTSGYASTQVKAPNQYKLNILIEARVRGSESKATFQIATANNGVPYQFGLTSTHDFIETAGVPFGFIVSLKDNLGQVIENFTGPITLTWNSVSQHAWAWNGNSSSDYSLPSGTMTCVFVSGICTTPIQYQVTDSSQLTYLSVGNGPGGYVSVFNMPMTVLPAAASKIVFARAPGGPKGADAIGSTSDDAVAIQNPEELIRSTDEPQTTIYAAIVDSIGNYYSDAQQAAWLVTDFPGAPAGSAGTRILPYIGTPSGSASLIGPAIVLTPHLTGSARIQASASQLTGFLSYRVNPGQMKGVLLTTEHNQLETAGVPFKINISVVDAKGNPLIAHHDGTQGFTGSFEITASFLNASADPPVSRGCNRFMLSGDNTFHQPASFNTPSSIPANLPPSISIEALKGCGSRTYQQTFLNGVANADLSASLNYANQDGNGNPGNYPTLQPQISVQINNPPVGTPSAFNPAGMTPVIQVNRGPGTRIELHSNQLNNGSFILDQYAVANGYPYWLDAVGVALPATPSSSALASRTFYAVLTDAAGNTISSPSDTQWSTTGVFDGEFATSPPSSPITGSSAIYTPITAGAGTLALYSPSANNNQGAYTLYTAQTSTADHFAISISDGTNPTNTIDVTRPLTLTIEARDSSNQLVLLNGSYYMNAFVTGHTASNQGTSPIVPTSGTYNFTNGVATISGLKIPKQSNTVQIGLTLSDISGTHCSTPASITQGPFCNPGTAFSPPTVKNFLVPTLIPGSPTTLSLRSGPAETDPIITASSISLTTDSEPTYYATGYDSELNYIGVLSGINWSSSTLITGPVAATYSTGTHGAIQFHPQNTGTGVLTALLSSGLSSSTGTITVGVGEFHHFSLKTQAQVSNASLSPSTTAGTAFTLRLEMQDSKNNRITTFDSAAYLTFNIVGSTPTIYPSYIDQKPADGNYTFTGGVLNTPDFILYNSATTPTIQITGLGKTATLASLSVSNRPLSHLRMKVTPATTTPPTLIAGSSVTYSITGVDPYGNTVSSGATANQTITFQFSSNLGGQDILSTTLASASDTSGAANLSVTGNLNQGLGSVSITATQTGTLSVQAGAWSTLSSPQDIDHVTVLPEPTIANVDWSPNPPSTYTASNQTPMSSFSARIRDRFNNVITTNDQTLITVSLSGGTGVASLLDGPKSQVVSAGVATFSDLKYPKVETIKLIATELTSNTVSSERSIQVIAGTTPARTLVIGPGQSYQPGVLNASAAVTGTISPLTAGTSTSWTIRAVDEGFNTVSGYNGSATFNLSDPNVTLAPQNFSSGVINLSFIPRTAWKNQTLSAATSLSTVNLPSSKFTVNPAAASQIVLVLPGQGQAITEMTDSSAGPLATVVGPGLKQGASSLENALNTPVSTGLTTTNPFQVNAYATDPYFNVVTSGVSGSVTLTNDPSDPNASGPSTQTLNSGVAQFSGVYYRLAKTNYTIQCTNTASLPSNNPSSLFNIDPGAASQTVVLLPGESLVAGRSTLESAKEGSPSSVTAGVHFTVTVKAVDPYFNTVTSFNTGLGTLSLTAPDTHTPGPSAQAFSSGVATFSVQNYIASSANLRATGSATSGLNNHQSTTYSVTPNLPTQTVAVLTDLGQTLSEGWAIGSLTSALPTSGLNPKTAGQSFQVKVIVVDDHYNRVSSVPSTPISLETNDPYDTHPSSGSLSSGEVQFTVTTRTAGTTRTLNAAGGSYNNQQSSQYTVQPATLDHTLTLLPGETFEQGSPTGKSGTPFPITTDSNFIASVYAVDLFNNRVTSSSNSVSITYNEPSSEHANPTTPTQFSSGLALFTLTPITLGSNFKIETQSSGLASSFSEVFTVSMGLNRKTIAVLPGQVFSGAKKTFAGAVTGPPSIQTAGVPFNVNVYRTDSKFNIVTNDQTTQVTFVSSDSAASMPAAQTLSNGQTTISVTLGKSSTHGSGWTLTPIGPSGNLIDGVASNEIRVKHNTITKAVVLPPGLSLNKGYNTGVVTLGSASPQTAGSAFNIQVSAIDDWNNEGDDANEGLSYDGSISINLTAADAHSNVVNPATSSFVKGRKEFSGTFYTAGTGRVITLATPLGTNIPSPGITVKAASPDHVLQIAGGAQTAEVNTAVPIDPEVEVRDRWLNPVADTPITFSVQSGGGSVNPAIVPTDAQGRAKTRYTLGTIAGSQILKAGAGFPLPNYPAQVAGTSPFILFTQTATPGAIAQLGFTTSAQRIRAGECSGITTLQTQDAYANEVLSASTRTINLAGSSVSFYSNSTCTDAISNLSIPSNTSTASFYFKSTVAGPITLTASTGGLSSGSQQETIDSAAPSSLSFITHPPSSATAGTPFNTVVQVYDAYTNPVTTSPVNVTLSISNNPTSATLVGTNPVATSISDGKATFNSLSIQKIGSNYTLMASVPGISSATSSAFTITPAAATQLGFLTQPSQVLAGNVITPSVQVAIQDSYGNTLSSATQGITLSLANNPTSASALGTLSVNADQGIATFSDLKINKTGTGYTYQAASFGFSPVTSSAFNVLANTPAQLAFTTSASPVAAGQCSNMVSIQTRDAYNNVTNLSAPMTLNFSSSSSGTAQFFTQSGCTGSPVTQSSILTSANSTSFYFKDTRAGSPTLTISSSLPNAQQTQTIQPAAASLSTLSSSPLNGTGPVLADGSQGIQLSVLITDAYGNAISGINPQFSATNTNSTNVQSSCSSTLSTGVSTCTLNSTYPETKTIELTAPTLSVSAISVPFNGLRITDNAGNPLLSPDSFGSVPLFSYLSHEYFIRNISSVPITLGSAQVTGTQFSLPTDNCSNQILAPNGYCTVQVLFSGGPTQTYSGNFSISGSPGGSVSQSLTGQSP